MITTIGLVVHSMADGFAFGSSAFSDLSTLSNLHQVVFFALMLHKCPAAIGLTSFLMHEGLKFKEIVKHLLAFTLSSPICALVTFYTFSALWDRNASNLQAQFYVGMFLLISAGTFLYVAMIHILPEVYCSTDTHRPHTHKHLPEDHVHDKANHPKEVELAGMMLGLMTPFFL